MWCRHDDEEWGELEHDPMRRPRRMRREMFRGDTLFFLDQAWRDVSTGQVFTHPPEIPGTPPPRALPYDLTGVQRLWVTVKRYVQDPDNQAVLQLDNLTLGGVTIVAGTDGRFSVQQAAPPLAFVGFPDGLTALRFDMQLKDSTSRIITIEFGRLVLVPDVTRATA